MILHITLHPIRVFGTMPEVMFPFCSDASNCVEVRVVDGHVACLTLMQESLHPATDQHFPFY